MERKGNICAELRSLGSTNGESWCKAEQIFVSEFRAM
jgi:hypothetical protein